MSDDIIQFTVPKVTFKTRVRDESVEDEKVNFDDTTQIVDTYIEAVDTDLDKDRIKIQVRELMTEAQSLEIA